jgi:membrane-associated phospholipid phosphatase
MCHIGPMGGWQPRVGRPLLPGGYGTAAGWLTAGSATLVAALGVLFAGQSTADGFDRAIDTPVIGWLSGQPDLRLWLAWPGTIEPAAALVVLTAAACLRAGRLNGALLAVTAVPIAVGLDEALLKPLIRRTYLGNLAYPSGHVTTVAALAATLSVLLLIPPPAGTGTGAAGTRLLRILLPAAAWAVTVVVAVAVISLRWHYVTDTLAGAAVGTGTAALLGLILDRPWLRHGLTRACRAWPAPDPATGEPDAPRPGHRCIKE